MGWDKDSLLSKSKVFFEKAFQEDRDDIFFGLYCAMGLEVLARATLSKISPALLAEPDREHRHLLHALKLTSTKGQNKSIGTVQVLTLCKQLIPEFLDEDFKIAQAIISRRNEEVHTGIPAFLEYTTKLWIAGFYRTCKVFANHLEEDLESLFGSEEAEAANLIIAETHEKLIKEVQTLINAHKKVFEAKDKSERDTLKLEADKLGEVLSHKRHHKVVCPACGNTATVQGNIYGKDNIEHREGEIIIRQNVIPSKFNCPACTLKLDSYGALAIAGIGDHFTHRTHYMPEEYYDLISPDDYDTMERYIEERALGYYEFSND